MSYSEICGVLGTYGMLAGVSTGAAIGGLTTETVSGAVIYGLLGGAAGAALGGFILPAVVYGTYTTIRDINRNLSAE